MHSMTARLSQISLLIAAVFLVSCATAPTAPTPASAAFGVGSSYSTAIIVPATTEMAGVRYEHEYIRSHYAGSRFISQSLSTYGGKPYDVMTFATSDGKQYTLYFDISRYFGRF
jgi:hypothetical protein